MEDYESPTLESLGYSLVSEMGSKADAKYPPEIWREDATMNTYIAVSDSYAYKYRVMNIGRMVTGHMSVDEMQACVMRCAELSVEVG